MKKLFSALLFVLLSLSMVTAQTNTKAARKNVKKQIATARDNIKKGTNLEDAEQQMRILLEDSANTDNEKIWTTLFDAIKKQHEVLNEALYLKQESDTAKFFTHILHLFSLPDVYIEKYSSYLTPLRKNLFGGGGFYLKRQDYETAYKYFDRYLAYEEVPAAAVWATYCGYKLDDAKKAEKHAALALEDPKYEEQVLEYLATTYAQSGDTVAYYDTLLRGFEHHKDNPFFFKRLAMYYSKESDHDEVLRMAEQMLQADSTNVAALEAKASALFHKEQYAECIEVCEKIKAADPSRLSAYVNAGLSYYNQSVSLSEKARKTRQEMRQLNDLYMRALPYLETFRQMDPEAVAVWGVPLYNIYFNLNMGEEFDEMEKLLASQKEKE